MNIRNYSHVVEFFFFFFSWTVISDIPMFHVPTTIRSGEKNRYVETRLGRLEIPLKKFLQASFFGGSLSRRLEGFVFTFVTRYETTVRRILRKVYRENVAILLATTLNWVLYIFKFYREYIDVIAKRKNCVLIQTTTRWVKIRTVYLKKENQW